MAIIWCGGEEIDFPVRLDCSIDTGTYRAGFSRGALRLTSTNGYFDTPAFTPRQTMWMSTRFHMGDNRNTSRLFLVKNGTTEVFRFRYNDTTTKIELWPAVGGAMLAETTTGWNWMTSCKLDFCIEGVGAGPFGRVRIWRDGQLVMDYNGDISNGQTEFDRIRWVRDTTYIFECLWSEIILADEDTRLFSLKTLAPQADAGELAPGANTFTSGDYTGVDEVVNSDSDTLYSEVADQEFRANLTNLPAGNFIVKAVKVAGRFACGPDGVNTVRIGIRSFDPANAASYVEDLSSAIPLTTAWAEYEKMYLTNPRTGVRFTSAEVNALQLAVKSGG